MGEIKHCNKLEKNVKYLSGLTRKILIQYWRDNMLKKKNWIQIVLSLLCSIFLAVMAGNINSEGTISFAMLGLFLLSLIALLFSAKVQGKDDLKNKILETFKFLGITFMSAVILSTVYGIVSQILLTQIGSYVVTNTAIIMITMFLAPIFLLNVFSEKLTLELSNRYLKVLLLELIFIGMGLIDRKSTRLNSSHD